jgi:L-2-hydroxyglutarate oxidase LhgO
MQRIGVIGGGIVGLAVARELIRTRPGTTVIVLEKEPDVARHQTGRNSGVVHAGLYYPPGSLKATLCRRGAGLLKDFCAEHDIAFQEVGKVLVALDSAEVARLDAIEVRAAANQVPGVRRLGPEGLREIEPHVTGLSGLHSPHTAITDYPGVSRALAREIEAAGGEVHTGTLVTGIAQGPAGVRVTTSTGDVEVDLLIACAGLQADRVARMAGDDASPRIVPFRGEYHLLAPERTHLVNGLVYPVPDPAYPFLGVHLTRRVDGTVDVGPNAVLALAREGYRWRTLRGRDLAETLAWPGFRRMARTHWRMGIDEMRGSLSRRRFAAMAQRYLPELRVEDLRPGVAGVRAQAVDRDGTLVDDFRITRRDRVVSVRNAPSPAATSALAIAEHVVRELPTRV